ncbi:hypothetical protein BJF83_02375 [Nocardiopsis sp. CNR-923]|nr:hypothetical protein BJF83_02375 [Nocardiopsis sp. CNR-923]
MLGVPALVCGQTLHELDQIVAPMAMYLADLCTIPSNLAGNTSLSVPCGLAPEDGLPAGFQIMAPALADDRTYRVAAAVERALSERDGDLLARNPYAV